MKRTLEALKKAPAKYGEFADNHPYAATVAETLALRGLRMGLNAASKRRGIDTGNALAGEYLDKAAEHPLKSAAMMTLAAPVGEEVMARIIPGEVSKRLKERHPLVGNAVKAASILGFAAVHSGILRFPEGADDSKFPSLNTDPGKMSLPVSHFVSALNYYRLQDQRGPSHNIVGHIANNTVGTLLSAPAVYRRRRQQRQSR